MRLSTALITALVVLIGSAAIPADLSAASLSHASAMDQPPADPPRDAAQPDEDVMTTAGWGNILWIVIVLVLFVGLVGAALFGLRRSHRLRE